MRFIQDVCMKYKTWSNRNLNSFKKTSNVMPRSWVLPVFQDSVTQACSLCSQCTAVKDGSWWSLTFVMECLKVVFIEACHLKCQVLSHDECQPRVNLWLNPSKWGWCRLGAKLWFCCQYSLQESRIILTQKSFWYYFPLQRYEKN